MSSVNKVILIGNLGQDPNVHHTQTGNKIVRLSVATSDKWTDKSSGEKHERTEWHRVVVFDPHLCDIAEKYLRKGSKVFLEGQLQTRKWTGQDNVERYTTEVVLNRFKSQIVMLSGRDGGEQSSPAPASEERQAGSDMDGDDIPF